MTAPMPKAPAGVVRSPSCLFAETPRWPSQAVQGPPVASQQRPALRQRRTVPWVEERLAVTTVTSWAAEPVEASRLASAAGQVALLVGSPSAEAANANAASIDSAIGRMRLQTTRR
jgi:hypothetical protein